MNKRKNYSKEFKARWPRCHQGSEDLNGLAAEVFARNRDREAEAHEVEKDRLYRRSEGFKSNRVVKKSGVQNMSVHEKRNV
jgi:ribosomal protein L34E